MLEEATVYAVATERSSGSQLFFASSNDLVFQFDYAGGAGR